MLEDTGAADSPAESSDLADILNSELSLLALRTVQLPFLESPVCGAFFWPPQETDAAAAYLSLVSSPSV